MSLPSPFILLAQGTEKTVWCGRHFLPWFGSDSRWYNTVFGHEMSFYLYQVLDGQYTFEKSEFGYGTFAFSCLAASGAKRHVEVMVGSYSKPVQFSDSARVRRRVFPLLLRLLRQAIYSYETVSTVKNGGVAMPHSRTDLASVYGFIGG